MRTLAATAFLPAAAPQPLGDDAIHLWLFRPWRGPPQGAAESALVRQLLGGYLQRRPDELEFRRGEHGKPRLADDALQFNLAHSGDALLLALSRNQALGVDLELPRRPRPALELAARYFDAGETTALARLPAALQEAAFLGLWSCKEAVLKAHGGGIGFGLERAVFALDGKGRVARMLGFASGSSGERWHVVRLDLAADVSAALAWQGRDLQVQAFMQMSV